jgi:putative oxidoreductase
MPLPIRTDAPPATVLIRFMVGLVFAPDFMGPFVGVVEVLCGVLILLGLATRLAAIPLLINMLVAIASTKVPILFGHGYWIFAHTFAPKAGLWAFLHESRTDISMLCGSAFLALAGAGPWSIDSAWHAAKSSQYKRQ